MLAVKFSKAEWAAVALSAALLVFFAGWYARGAWNQDAYTVSGQHPPQPVPSKGQTFVPGQVVDLNTATLSDLLTLPGIGETRAQAILDYRQANGPFRWSEDLMDVPGIGQSVFAELEPYVTAASPSPSPQ